MPTLSRGDPLQGRLPGATGWQGQASERRSAIFQNLTLSAQFSPSGTYRPPSVFIPGMIDRNPAHPFVGIAILRFIQSQHEEFRQDMPHYFQLWRGVLHPLMRGQLSHFMIN